MANNIHDQLGRRKEDNAALLALAAIIIIALLAYAVYAVYYNNRYSTLPVEPMGTTAATTGTVNSTAPAATNQ